MKKTNTKKDISKGKSRKTNKKNGGNQSMILIKAKKKPKKNKKVNKSMFVFKPSSNLLSESLKLQSKRKDDENILAPILQAIEQTSSKEDLFARPNDEKVNQNVDDDKICIKGLHSYQSKAKNVSQASNGLGHFQKLTESFEKIKNEENQKMIETSELAKSQNEKLKNTENLANNKEEHLIEEKESSIVTERQVSDLFSTDFIDKKNSLMRSELQDSFITNYKKDKAPNPDHLKSLLLERNDKLNQQYYSLKKNGQNDFQFGTDKNKKHRKSKTELFQVSTNREETIPENISFRCNLGFESHVFVSNDRYSINNKIEVTKTNDTKYKKIQNLLSNGKSKGKSKKIIKRKYNQNMSFDQNLNRSREKEHFEMAVKQMYLTNKPSKKKKGNKNSKKSGQINKSFKLYNKLDKSDKKVKKNRLNNSVDGLLIRKSSKSKVRTPKGEKSKMNQNSVLKDTTEKKKKKKKKVSKFSFIRKGIKGKKKKEDVDYYKNYERSKSRKKNQIELNSKKRKKQIEKQKREKSKLYKKKTSHLSKPPVLSAKKIKNDSIFKSKKNPEKKNDSKLIRRPDYLENGKLKYFIGKGNNDQLIKLLMQKRGWWEEYKAEEKGTQVY